ncbi:lipoyl synthase [Candidatus Woesearchaeota archaeon]|nr:lipoyl synthase [Candidatus Woesearchaeota archaeon]
MVINGKPGWFKIPLPNNKYEDVKKILKENNIVTVCQESKCPNLSECWSGGTVTFMIMGDTCTRGCRFCHIKTGFKPKSLDITEPDRLVRTLKLLDLDYAVITSVDRDDLKDQGSGHFAKCIKKIKMNIPDMLIEVLIPDFRGDFRLVQKIIEEKPNVIAHNIETIERLQKEVRDPRAGYEQSLSVLKYINGNGIIAKSSIMVGFGETKEEIIQTMKDLRNTGVQILTIGQYLQPSQNHLKIREYVIPEVFNYYKNIGMQLGFKYVASGPFVRSSYKAGELFIKNLLKNNGESNA